jgi:hypothetical protein
MQYIPLVHLRDDAEDGILAYKSLEGLWNRCKKLEERQNDTFTSQTVFTGIRDQVAYASSTRPLALPSLVQTQALY